MDMERFQNLCFLFPQKNLSEEMMLNDKMWLYSCLMKQLELQFCCFFNILPEVEEKLRLKIKDF